MILLNQVNARKKCTASVGGARAVIWAFLLTSLAAVTFAVSADVVPETHAVSIGGYSPVSYFTKGIAELGSVDYAVTHNGRVYYLTSDEQVALYRKNPDKYRPRHDVCSFSLADGSRKPLDPTNFKVIGDTLLLFHKAPGVDGLAGWNASKLTDAELLSRADNQLLLLRF